METMEKPVNKDEPEVVLYAAHPAMFRNHPAYFVLCLLLIAVFGLGLLMLLVWWIQVLGTTLTVTSEQTTLRKGILSKHTNDVFHSNVRNIHQNEIGCPREPNSGSPGQCSAGWQVVPRTRGSADHFNCFANHLMRAVSVSGQATPPDLPSMETLQCR